MNDKKALVGPGVIVLIALAAVCGVLSIYRFIKGIGAVSNLSDGYPWGFWIGLDVLSGVALAAGGFTVAAAVHLFGREKYRPVLRPAILTAFVGYVFVALALLVDLGRGWDIWHALIWWNKKSVMFEVAWCVILYTTVLALEFAPAVLEKFKLKGLQRLYDSLAPVASVLLVTWFVYVMTGNLVYALITFVILAAFWYAFRTSLPKGSALMLLIIAGVIFSVAHQSSLGSLFLLLPHRLASLWYTPLLPVNFLVTAVAVGLAMVIFESTVSSRLFGFGLESDVIRGLGRALPWVLIVAAVLKFASLYGQTGYVVNATEPQMFSFWLEVIVGLALPFVLLLLPAVRNSAKAIVYPAILVIAGLVLNRMNVAFIGMDPAGYARYTPHVMEVMITVGIISAGMLVYYFACYYLPVFERQKA